jgi:hypothetical protein
LALVKRPGTLIIEQQSGARREYDVATEIGHLAWFADARDMVYTEIDRTFSAPGISVGISLWIVNLNTGDTHQISQPEELIHSPMVSPSEVYIAGISGDGYGDACFFNAYLDVVKLDGDQNWIKTYSLADISGFENIPGWDEWLIHPRNIEWQNGHTFTVELWASCLPSFETAIYLIDMDTLEAERIRVID